MRNYAQIMKRLSEVRFIVAWKTQDSTILAERLPHNSRQPISGKKQIHEIFNITNSECACVAEEENSVRVQRLTFLQ